MLRTGTGPEDEGGDADALAAHLTPSLTSGPLVPPARDRITRVP
jgi:hypothetical protein